ncbi:MAG: gliding motility-associated ABC transporter ATP-binding subunit GldA [Flavobacterium sp.]|jgi:ABC-2 type transport system ATP-binding protein
MSIKVVNIVKKYGNQIALNHISFEIEKGEILGLLGPNGAGKSSLMKIMTTFNPADSGEIWINGFNVATEPLKVQKSIGYLPEHNPLYLEMYVREYLEFNANLHQVSNNRIEEVIVMTGLLQESYKKISALSKGYRQRVGLATALLHNPDVLILDEPTTGLDPNQIIEIRNLIKNIGKDKTVILSTHIMQEVEAICDRVIILDHGNIVAENTLEKIKEINQKIIEITFENSIDIQLFKTLNYLTHVENNSLNSYILTFETHEDMRPVLFDFAQKNNLKLLELHQKNKDLESVFRNVTN